CDIYNSLRIEARLERSLYTFRYIAYASRRVRIARYYKADIIFCRALYFIKREMLVPCAYFHKCSRLLTGTRKLLHIKRALSSRMSKYFYLVCVKRFNRHFGIFYEQVFGTPAALIGCHNTAFAEVLAYIISYTIAIFHAVVIA